MQPTAQLRELVRTAAKPNGFDWLEQALQKIRDGANIAVLFPAAARKLGRGSLNAPTEASHQTSLAAWRVDDGGRVLMLAELKACKPDEFGAVMVDLYQRGDGRERVGVLRGLAFLGEDPSLVSIVLDALRTNEGSIFEAALCENPYASKFLPELEFRKNVLKAVFVGISIRRVVGLAKRADAQLSSSMIDYIAEREAASRSVVPELWPFVALYPPAGATAKIMGYLEHADPEHRTASAEALAIIVQGGDTSPLPFLQSRAERETDPVVKDALSSALARCEA